MDVGVLTVPRSSIWPESQALQLAKTLRKARPELAIVGLSEPLLQVRRSFESRSLGRTCLFRMHMLLAR